MKLWIEATRPKTLIASLSPVLIGGANAFEAGYFSLPIFTACAFFAVAVQMGTNFANDYLDFLRGVDTHQRQGPRRLVQAGLISFDKMRRATFGVFTVAGLIGIYLLLLGGWQIGALALCAIIFGYLYTGGPLPLSYLGVGDFFVLLFFGPVATGGVTYLLMGKIVPIAAIAGLAPGCLSTAILVMNNLRDCEEDRRTQKKSLPVRLGINFGKWELAICILIGILVPCFLVLSTGRHWWSLLSLITLFPGIRIISQTFRGRQTHNFALLFPQLGKLLTLYTFLFSAGWIL